MTNGFFENKVEEILQLLSANNELLEKQVELLERMLGDEKAAKIRTISEIHK